MITSFLPNLFCKGMKPFFSVSLRFEAKFDASSSSKLNFYNTSIKSARGSLSLNEVDDGGGGENGAF